MFRPARFHPAALALLAALLLGVPNAMAGGPDFGDHAQTCRHFENRARFQPRGPDAPFEVRFADSCRIALGMARLGPSAPEAALAIAPEVREARRYLERLTGLRLEVAAMNRARLYGENAGRRAQPRLRPQGRIDAGFGGVTRTGEYLIARHLGVMDALQRWNVATLHLARR